MTIPLPDAPFDPDDPRGWPVCATIVVRLDQRAMSDASQYGFYVDLDTQLPSALICSVVLRQIATLSVRPEFQEGLAAVQSSWQDPEEGDRRG